ncbi:unnamed protein product [Choristocarpus tenellus]
MLLFPPPSSPLCRYRLLHYHRRPSVYTNFTVLTLPAPTPCTLSLPSLQLVGFGEVADEYNFSTERKRILNHKYEPSFDDNVKQDKSIDVYGREDDEVATAKQIDDLANM